MPPAVTRLSPGERATQQTGRPTGIRVELVDPFENERQENAKHAAGEKNRKKKKKDRANEKSTRTLASGEEIPVPSTTLRLGDMGPSQPEGTLREQSTAEVGENREANGKRPQPKPKRKARSLTENASDALRAKVDVLSGTARESEIERLNGLSVEALAMEAELARVEALGADATTQEDFVQPAPDSPRGNGDPSSASAFGSQWPLTQSLLDAIPLPGPDGSTFMFQSDLYTMPNIPENPNDPLVEPLVWPGAIPSLLGDIHSNSQQASHFPLEGDATQQTESLQSLGNHLPGPPLQQPVLEADSTPAAPATFAGAPKWLMEYYHRFDAEELPVHLRQVWTELLRDWMALERTMGFARPVCHSLYFQESPTDVL